MTDQEPKKVCPTCGDEHCPEAGNKYPTTAEKLLDLFKHEMLKKLQARQKKHPDDNFLSMSVEQIMNMDLRAIMDHMNQEIEELYVARAFPDKEKGHTPEKEDVDVANMGFIEWAIRKMKE